MHYYGTLISHLRFAVVRSVVTLGAQGCLLMSRVNDDQDPSVQYFPAQSGIIVANATGAVEAGMKAAVASLKCPDRAISSRLGEHK